MQTPSEKGSFKLQTGLAIRHMKPVITLHPVNHSGSSRDDHSREINSFVLIIGNDVLSVNVGYNA